MIEHPIPKENKQIFCYLYRIETVLRELIIDSLEAIEGGKWYKRRLPGDVLEKYSQGIKYERNTKWIQLVPHHPIYYTDFSDLKKVIIRNDNWEDVFKQIFVRKEILNSTLSELEHIRNKIAHNRKASFKDFEIVKGAYAKLSVAIGEEKFYTLVSRCTCATDIMERLTELQKETKKLLHVCKNYEFIEKLEVWESIYCKWWFDESYLGHKIDDIKKYFEIIKEYLKTSSIRKCH